MVGYIRRCVRHAIPEVEPGRVATLAVAEEGIRSRIPVTAIEGDHGDAVVIQEPRDTFTPSRPEATDGNDFGLQKSWGADSGVGGLAQSRGIATIPLLSTENRDHR